VPVLRRDDQPAGLQLVRARHDCAAPPLSQLQADGYYSRTRVLELRHEVQKRDGMEDSINHFDLRACYHPQRRHQGSNAVSVDAG